MSLCLKNMAFQADQKVKVEIIRCLGTEQLFRLLSDPDSNVLMKTLGLLRNLLSTRPVKALAQTPWGAGGVLLFCCHEASVCMNHRRERMFVSPPPAAH